MKSAGGEPCLYMHGWWKNVSLNGSQLSTALRTAKTRRGNKIWHYYYYPAIINYPLSPSLPNFHCLCSFLSTHAHVHTDLNMHTQAFGTFSQTDPRGGTCLEEITKNMRSPTDKPQNLHFKTLIVALQFSWYTMTAGYAPC